MFEKFFGYIRNNPEGFWFKRKLFGWGWYPANKKGWAVTLLYVLLIVAILVFAPKDEDSNLLMRSVFVGFPVLLSTGIFIWIAYKKGEKPKWQWGNEKKDE